MARTVYVAFDSFPAPKGAAVHMDAFVRALGASFGPVDLVTPAASNDPADPVRTEWPASYPYCQGVAHQALPALGPSMIERALYFRGQLARWWPVRRPEIVQVRSIYEGYPIARFKGRLCTYFVFEVNGLPSIELKYGYPAVADDPELLGKLIAQEDRCLEAADLVITVSSVNARYLLGRGVSPAKIRVIPNGVDVERFTFRPARPWADRCVRLFYAGTMASWQGVHLAIEALALYRRDHPAHLTLVGPARAGQRKALQERISELRVSDSVELKEPVSQDELARWHRESDVVLAPLLPNDRNLVQGCCPLKVLEAMASGTPLIASDLPVVRELAEADVHALLVKPGSAKAIKDAVLRLRAEPDLGPRLARAARSRIERKFRWAHQQLALRTAYEEVLGVRAANSFNSAARAAASA